MDIGNPDAGLRSRGMDYLSVTNIDTNMTGVTNNITRLGIGNTTFDSRSGTPLGT